MQDSTAKDPRTRVKLGLRAMQDPYSSSLADKAQILNSLRRLPPAEPPSFRCSTNKPPPEETSLFLMTEASTTSLDESRKRLQPMINLQESKLFAIPSFHHRTALPKKPDIKSPGSQEKLKNLLSMVSA